MFLFRNNEWNIDTNAPGISDDDIFDWSVTTFGFNGLYSFNDIHTFFFNQLNQNFFNNPKNFNYYLPKLFQKQRDDHPTTRS